MKQIFTIVLILIFSASMFAQEQGVCGVMPTEEAMANLMKSRAMFEQLDIYQIEETKYIPVKFHLIGETGTGNGRVKETQILKLMCKLNADYTDTEFQFYLKDASFSYFNSTSIFNNVSSSQLATNQMKALKNANNNAINVFVVNNIGAGQGGLGIILGYYTGQYDWIVLKKSEANELSNTTPHEMGHFFSLAHTFFGYEGDPFEEGDTGWPVAPVYSPNGPKSELQDGSNCAVAADQTCDTPPDYNFGIIWNSCNYTGGAQDPSGTVVDPMENNQMSYFNGCEPYTFTAMQTNDMLGNYNLPTRNYLKYDYIPNTSVISDKPTLESPVNNSEVPGTIGVTLTWKPVTNASHYILEVSRTSNFTVNNLTYNVTTTSKELPELVANKNYFWKVTPFNDGASCAMGLTSTKWKFHTAPVAVSNIAEINAWDVMPNPTASTIGFTIELAKSIDVTAQVISSTGQIIQSVDMNLPAGKQVAHLPNVALSNGTYFLRLTTKNGVETRRVSVQK